MHIDKNKTSVRKVLDVYTSRFKVADITIEDPPIEEIIEELEEILRRDFNESDDFIKEQVRLIKEYAEVVEIKERVVIVKEDFKDNKIIECAISASADFIISGDNHLLRINEYRGIKIISPREFIDMLAGEVV